MTSEQDATTQLFVVDCYDHSGRVGRQVPIPALPSGTRLAYLVRVPSDDLVQALVEGTDQASVQAALTAAGWHVDRITAATWAHPDEEDGEEAQPVVVLEPDGNLVTFHPDGSRHVHRPDGSWVLLGERGPVAHGHRPRPVSRPPATTVVQQANGTVVVTHPDGSRELWDDDRLLRCFGAHG